MKLQIIFIVMFCFSTSICIGQSTATTRSDRLRDRYLNPQKYADETNRIWIMAHRGLWDEENPESSLGAIKNAVKYGFEIVELDVRFSARFDYDKNTKECKTNNQGKYRAIIFCHDISPNRAPDGIGLIDFPAKITFNSDATLANRDNIKFIRLQKLVPYNNSNKNTILFKQGDTLTAPVLLKLDSTKSQQRLLYYNPADPDYNNADIKEFVEAVKGKILINLDKLSSPEDFQETYDFVKSMGLLHQCIFKAKELRDYQDLMNLFGNRVEPGAEIMFTPIFTQFDSKLIKNNYQANLSALINCYNSLINESSNFFKIAGAEIIYENDVTEIRSEANPNPTNKSFLTELAMYINYSGGRVIQFGVIPGNQQGEWTGNSCEWSFVTADHRNFWWDWLFNNPKIKGPVASALPSVFVGDKPLEFRAYLNSHGYNQKIIN